MKDLNCYQCRDNQAKYLLYFVKQYKDRDAYRHPQLLCNECAKQFRTSEKITPYQEIFRRQVEITFILATDGNLINNFTRYALSLESSL